MKNLQQDILERLHPCSVQELEIAQAREVANALAKRRWFALRECKRLVPETPAANPPLIAICRSMDDVEKAAANPGNDSPETAQPPVEEEIKIEAIWFDVEIEVQQFPVYPIAPVETLVALFIGDGKANGKNDVQILTLATREDFPPVPHLYSEVLGLGRSLCLWEQSQAELRLIWTGERYFERIREWLRLAARGELHPPDQALAPLLYPTRNYLVAPNSLFEVREGCDEKRTFGGMVRTVGDIQTFLVRPEDIRQDNSFVAVAFAGTALTQRAIQSPPKNLGELRHFAAQLSVDFFISLQGQFDGWINDANCHNARVVFAFTFPQSRIMGGESGRFEQHAFATYLTVVQIAEALGYWGKNSKVRGTPWVQLMNSGPESWEKRASGIELVSLNVTPLLSRDVAAQLNASVPVSARVIGIGAGALGSQAILNLARAGWGDWQVLDNDLYLPHNGARHALSGQYIGSPKVAGVCELANSLFDESFVAKPLVGDVLVPSDALKEAIENTELVLDFSASVPVARALSHDYNLPGRALSLFLNPSGTQLFALAEDGNRAITLADLEMQLWQAIVEREGWKDYFETFGTAVQYARSCGDKSSRIPQELVALHATNASRAVRHLHAESSASITRWVFDPESETQTRDQLEVSAVRVRECGDWTLRASEGLIARLRVWRAERLPSETGGILVGTLDRERKIAYLVSVLPAPPDSEASQASFLRGCQGLREQVEAIQQLTGYQVGYLGEWHSHPKGRDSQPSPRDFRHFEYLRLEREQDGMPAVLVIIGENDESTFIGTMPETASDSPTVTVILVA